MKVTRRQLAAALAAAAAAPSQTPAPQTAPADLLKTARDRMKAAADALAKEQIPMATEPAVVFHAEQ